MLTARMPFRAAAGSTAGGFCGDCAGREVAAGSGGVGAADADLGGRGGGGQTRPAGREARPGLGFPVAVPCRSRSMTTRRRARPARMASRLASVSAAGRLAVAAPDRVEVMTARRAA